MSVENKKWGGKFKIAARNETIIKKYYERFGHKQLPKDLQYWTLCGELGYGDGKINKKNEFFHMTTPNKVTGLPFITEDQFKGVECNKEIFNKNKKLFPNLDIYFGDISVKMSNNYYNGLFNPGLVNLDLITLAEKSAQYLPAVLLSVGRCAGPIMLVCNIVMSTYYHTPQLGTGTDDHNLFIAKLNENSSYRKAIQDLWDRDEKCYMYKGNDKKSKTTMCSYIFYRKNSAL